MSHSHIDSNRTGLRYAEEASFKVLPAAALQFWKQLQPNSYPDWGGEVVTVASNPINPDRQRQKGAPVDLNASGGHNEDLRASNLEDILQGFFFADLDEPGTNEPNNGTAFVITNVDGTSEDYDTGAGDWTAAPAGMVAGNLVLASGFTNAENNGLKTVTAVAAGALTVSQDLVDETPPATSKVEVVGHQFDSATVDVVAAAGGNYPFLTRASGVVDWTTLGIPVGAHIFIGGDGGSPLAFVTSTGVNNGFARVREVTATTIVLDKHDNTMEAETGTGLTVQIFWGKVLKNQLSANIVRRTYSLERTLDADDSGNQAEYLDGAVPNELAITVPVAELIKADLGFVAGDHVTIPGSGTVRSEDAVLDVVDAIAEDPFNSSSDVSRIKMAQVVAGDENPTSTFDFLTELNLNLTNGITPLKAISVFGAFDASADDFEISGSVTAYFTDTTGQTAVRNTQDITMDFQLVKENTGISFDVPLVTLGDGRLTVEAGQPITLPLSFDAASGKKVHTNLDHTLAMVFFPYLPTLADS